MAGGVEAGEAAGEAAVQPPFDSLAFTLVEQRGRSMVRLSRQDDGLYALAVQQGSGGNPTVDFTRHVPHRTAQALKDALQEAGVFGWDAEYGDLPGFGMLRWNLKVVFKRDVYTFAAQGGNDVPAGFDDLMEQLYRLDLPRPEEGAAPRWRHEGAGFAGSLGGLGGAAGMDFERLAQAWGGSDGQAAGQMRELFEQMAGDPAALQRRAQEEFAHLPPAEQQALLDELADMRIAPRSFWEKFLRGE